MGWLEIGAIDADRRDWQLSQPFTGNLIKIENEVTSASFNFYNFVGLIAINYDLRDFFEIKTFYSDPISQIFLFPNIPVNDPKYIAIKNVTKGKNNNQWTVRVFQWIQEEINIISLVGNDNLVGNNTLFGN